MKKKKLIIALIKDDLMNYRLIHGLQAMGIDASHYCSFLQLYIFKLMGFKKQHRNIALFERYQAIAQKAMDFDIADSLEPFWQLAQEIYEELRNEKHQHTMQASRPSNTLEDCR